MSEVDLVYTWCDDADPAWRAKRMATAQFCSEIAAQFQAAYDSINQILSAATMITLVPLIIIYLLAQKSFVESISQSGIKG